MKPIEDNHLAPFAASRQGSKGRLHDESEPNYRSIYQRDRDRIIHSSAFRRLEYKTQVFVNHEGDMFRTRLTHSLEVAQIARTMARVLNINEDLVEAISLAHDLGHTPFGHAGQDALNTCMQAYGGFEHNLQSLRVVDILEEKYAEFPGLNLTFETREGILKHCSKSNARELGRLGQRFLDRTQPGLEAQLVNIADAIAYNNHDVDDGLRSGLINEAQLCEVTVFAQQLQWVTEKWPSLEAKKRTHETIRRMINLVVIDLLTESQQRIESAAPASIDEVRKQQQPLISFSDEVIKMNQEMKHFLREHLYQHYRVRRMTTKAHKIIHGLFDVFMNDYKLLPYEGEEALLVASLQEADLARRVADYIAGMTDRYAIAEFGRILDVGELT